MKLDHYLVLNHWISSRLGAVGIEDLKDDFSHLEPGVGGESPYLRALLEREGVYVPPELLSTYDQRIRTYERRLSEVRGGFRWKYFQYLALLYLEILLDAMTSDPMGLVRDLNGHLAEMLKTAPHLAKLSKFDRSAVRRLAFYMATGSGKTLLMHANLWQVFHYLEESRHPESLVRRPDDRREFDNVLLVTPNEGLSRQHLEEFRRSGIDAVHLAFDEPSGWLFGPQVRVIEISKLAEEVTGEGLSIPLESLGGRNLVFVDEGHKGVGSEARTWKERQHTLSEHGLLLEYSATFAQSVAAVSRKAEARLLEEYGKSIVFDYSYRHFYNDGYGKHFEVLNLESDRSERAHELLVGGLLTFFQQVWLYDTKREALHPFEIESPLWVFLGARVIKSGKGDLGDVAQVVSFLSRFLEDREWAVDTIRRVLAGTSGFEAGDGVDLFAPTLDHLSGADPTELYEDILERVFHGRGGLEIWELKRADGEIALRAGTAADGDPRYFGLINVGDSGALRRHLEREGGFEVHADQFTDTLFPTLDATGSPLNLLIGSRKFIEGWSSWRVSSMGLMNMGRGEGPQVIQLFGRGVRLKGRGRSLQRSTGRGLDESELPGGLEHLETLYIFGWNADYISAFRKMLEAEEVGWEIEVPVLSLFDPEPELYVPRPKFPDDAGEQPFRFEPSGLGLRIDETSRWTALSGGDSRSGSLGQSRLLDFSSEGVAGLVDTQRLYVDLVEYKAREGHDGALIRPEALLPVLRECEVEVDAGDTRDPVRVQMAATRALTAYLDRLAARVERTAESRRMEPVRLEVREKAARPYRVRGHDPGLRDDIVTLIADRDRLHQTGVAPLPRLHVDRHLFSPLLLEPDTDGPVVSMSPAGLTVGERRFLEDLMRFWEAEHDTDAHSGKELFLLRNLPHSGVGFFRRSGFYPDFMLWEVSDGGSRLTFVEPHGMHHGGLDGNRDKIEALLALEEISDRTAFRDLGLRMRGFILTETKRAEIPGAGDRSWAELAEECRLLSQKTATYMGTILDPG